MTTKAENNSRLPGESQATSASTTRESTVAFAPDQLALDGRAPWPRGIPDQETVRSALLRGVKSPGMSASVQEIEEAFGRITNGAGAEVECLRTAMAVRWRLAAAASIAPGGSGFRFRRVNVDEEAATAMQDECEEVVLSLIALVANEKGGSQVGVLRGRFEREFANFREILNRLRQRADAATAVGSTASGTEQINMPSDAMPGSRARPFMEVPGTPQAWNPEASLKRPYVLAFSAAATSVATLCFFLWSPGLLPPPIALPEGVSAENVIIGKDGFGMIFSPDGRQIDRREAQQYAKSFDRQGISVVEVVSGQYILAPSWTIDKTAPVVKSP